jgi:predicted Zn finger-like uncharacterized protein
MPVTLSCPECQSRLRVRDDLAGKKVKCPRCAHLVLVPPREDDATEVLNAGQVDIAEVKPLPARSGKTTRRQPPPRKDDHHDRVMASKPRPKKRRHEEEDEDEQEEEGDDRFAKYKACPRCGAVGAKRVLWTFWGSFYGPAMFTHVRCPDCGYAYNGRTGGSNLIWAIIFVAVPLLGILAIFGVIAYTLHRLGYI